MNIIGITGRSGSGKSYFAEKLGHKLENSRVVNIDHIFFELLDRDEVIKQQIIKIYGKEAYNQNGNIDLSVIQKDENAFQNLFNASQDKLNERIITIIAESEKNMIGNLIFEWFMLPKTVAFDKSNHTVLVEPKAEDREKSLISRNPLDTPEEIKRRDSLLPINYLDFKYGTIVEHQYKEQDLDKYIDYLVNEMNIHRNKQTFSEQEIGNTDEEEWSFYTSDDEKPNITFNLLEEELAHKERAKQLLDNPEFMKKLDIIMRHNHQTHIYYYHGTALENAEKILKDGLYLRDYTDISVTAVREFDEMGLYAHRDVATEEELFEMEKKALIEYRINGGIGEECVVIIDQPKEADNIVQSVDDKNAPMLAGEWVVYKAQGSVNPKWIIGYVDKVNAEVIANPLYYDYAKVAEQLSPSQKEKNLVCEAVEITERQCRSSEINKQILIMKDATSRDGQKINTENLDARI